MRNHGNRTNAVAFAALLVALALVGCDGCKGDAFQRIATANRVVNATARLTEDTDRAFKAWGATMNANCLKLHGAKTPEYAKCVKPALDLLRAWTGEVNGKPTGKGILPAIQSAQRAARLSLDAAFDYVKANDAKAKCETDECKKKIQAWRALIRPGVCALVEIVDRGIKLGAVKLSEDPTYKIVKGFADASCSK